LFLSVVKPAWGNKSRRYAGGRKFSPLAVLQSDTYGCM
jgi:hypothetical protein